MEIKKMKEIDMEKIKKCPYAGKCGGCQYQGTDYSVQLKEKQIYVQKLLKNYGKPEPILGMNNPYYYRNKVHAVYKHQRNGEVMSGIYEEGTHKVVPVESCQIENQEADRVILTIRKLAKSFKIKIYNEDSGYGLLRHVLIRCGKSTGEMMVVLVAASPIFPSKNNFVKALRKEHPCITTVVLNINDRSTSMVLGDRNIVLYGKGYIEDELCGCRFRISPNSFYQVNPVQTEVLYKKAIALAGLNGKEKVIDAYCGIGTIGLIAASHCGEVIGIELNCEAVKDAVGNAKRNGIKNAKLYQGDAGEFLLNMAQNGERADVVFMDPPRAGSDEKFMASAVKMGPEKIVYISCNPETLKRDLQYLTGKGYRVKKICPVDMFPFTNHVETVVLLSKGEIDSKKVRVEFSLEDMNMSGFQKGATYEQIKAYVLEHTGLKVSSLYISQIKRKCGLDVGQNYNLSKKENVKVPKCPPEKEKAIMEALQYFRVVNKGMEGLIK